jgi:hypothetical protein
MKKLKAEILAQVRIGSDLYRWCGRLRQSFYNPDLYQAVPAAAKKKVWLHRLLNLPIALGGLALVLYFIPSLAFRWLPFWQGGRVLGEQVQADETTRIETQLVTEFSAEVLIQPQLEQNFGGEKIQPTYDLSAPEGRWFRAVAADINAEILTNNDLGDTKAVDGLMSRGAYLYPDYAEIGRVGRTVVLASHHYNMWLGAGDSQKTFQNLAQIQVGDTIEIIDDYKIWAYEVYKVEEAEVISEKTADLIAYTCVFWWDSKLRFFVYAKLVSAA